MGEKAHLVMMRIDGLNRVMFEEEESGPLQCGGARARYLSRRGMMREPVQCTRAFLDATEKARKALRGQRKFNQSH